MGSAWAHSTFSSCLTHSSFSPAAGPGECLAQALVPITEVGYLEVLRLAQVSSWPQLTSSSLFLHPPLHTGHPFPTACSVDLRLQHHT